jgi:hypothetical protein
MRNEDLLVDAALREIAGLFATAYQRYIKVARIAPAASEKELDNSPDSSTHVVDAGRDQR